MADANSKNLYLPITNIYGNRNADGTYTLSALDIKHINDNLYYLAKKIQGGLTMADLTSEAGQVVTDLEGNVSVLQLSAEGLLVRVENAEGDISSLVQTADGISTRVSNTETGITSLTDTTSGLTTDINTLTSNVSTIDQKADSISATVTQVQQTANGASSTAGAAYSKAQSVELTVDGMRVANNRDSYTIIDGGKLTSEGHANAQGYRPRVTIDSGFVEVGRSGADGSFGYDLNDSKVFLRSVAGAPLKIISGSNMSIDAGGTVFIGTSTGSNGNVDIGKIGGAIHLNGNVLVNGAPIGTGGGGTATAVFG